MDHESLKNLLTPSSTLASRHGPATVADGVRLCKCGCGKYFTKEHREKISTALVGKNTWMLGRRHSESFKLKLSKCSPRYWLGKHFSKKHRENMRLCRVGVKHILWGGFR